MSKTIDATPHPDTIRKVGEYGNYYDHPTSGRKGLPFAIAEKIDNSISATSGNTAEQGRKIDLYFLYDERDRLAHMAIKDNGTGMDYDALQAYATYNLSQDARKQDMEGGKSKVPVALENGDVPGDDPRWTINGNIGHFGVGGQHAAFCIGKTEHVMTKAVSPDKRKMHTPVLDFNMSTQKMLDERRKGKNCWVFPVEQRAERDTSFLSKEIETHPFLREFVENEPQGKESFTLMVVSLINDNVAPQLQPEGSQSYREKLQPTLMELAHVYHYYVHGKEGTQDLPEVHDEDEDSEGSDDSDSEEDDIRPVSGKRKKPSTRSDPKATAPKKTPAKKGGGSSSHVPREDVKVNIVVHAIKQQGSQSKNIFSCNLVEIPSVEVRLFKAQKSCFPVFMKINPDQGKKESVASMFLYYCPYLLDKETRPYDEYDKTEGPIFSCYWQGRLVPYAEISTLTIFDKLGQDKQFLKRVRGTIFFDRQILPSNSKLQFHQSVQDMMNNDAQCHRYKDWKSMVVDKQSDQTRAVHTAIRDWISKSHAEFDREIRVADIFDVVDKPGGRSGEKQTMFRKMIYAEEEYVTGAKMHFKSSKPYRYGVVEYFLCDGDLRNTNVQVTSTATIFYKRHPLELFGEDLVDEPVSAQVLGVVDEANWDLKVREIAFKLPSEIVVLKHKDDNLEYCKTSGKGSYKMAKSGDIVKEYRIENDFPNGTITAGYVLPAVSVFVLNEEGKILQDVVTATDSKVKLKIQDKIAQTHEWVGGKNVALSRPKVILGGLDRMQTVPDKNRGFYLDSVVQAFLGAGTYELSYHFPTMGSEVGERVKNLVWKQTLQVQPGKPFEALFKTTSKLKVNEVDGGEYSIGAKAKKARPITFFITDNEGKDPDEQEFTRGNICVLSDKESRDIKITAQVHKPEDSGLVMLFTTVKADKTSGEYMTLLQVKMDTDKKNSEVRAALEADSSVEVRFKLYIKISGRKERLVTRNEMVIRVRAGEPDKLVFHGDFSSETEIEMQNRQRVQKLPVKAVDQFGNTAHLDGSDKSKLIVTRKLVPVNASSEIQKRKVESYKFTASASTDDPISIFDIGGFRVHLDDPCVSRMEQHKLEVTAEFGGKEIDCSDLGIGVKVNPSQLPHSVRPMWSGGEITQKGSDWIIAAPAGSEATGVFFTLLDEAEDEVTDLAGWTVKWPKDKAKPFHGEATKMPPTLLREKTDDNTEKTIVFTGPRGEEVTAPTLSVSLTFVPYPTTPSSWKLVHPKTGLDLPDSLNITVGKPLRDFFAIQLLDKYGNPVDIKKLGQDGSQPVMTPVIYATTDKTGAKIEKMGFNDKVNLENYDFSDPKRIVPTKTFTLMGTAGDWTLTIKTFERASLGQMAASVRDFKQKIHLMAGEPTSLKMEISGLPDETEEEGEVPRKYSFGGPSLHALLAPGVSAETLSGLPSTCTIKSIEISVLDEVGNVLDKADLNKGNLKNYKLKLSLKNGRIAVGNNPMQDSISRGISNKRLSFGSVRLQAGKDSDGAFIADSMLELSSDFKHFKVVCAPIKFSPSSAVVSVRIIPDPYPDAFKVGQRLSKIIAELRTEDKTILQGDWNEGLSIKCFREDDGKDEDDDLFLPVRADELEKRPTDTTALYFLPGPGVLKHMSKKHVIRAFWRETRPSVRALIGDNAEVQSNSLTFSVHAGAPHTLVKAQRPGIKPLAHMRPQVSNKKASNVVIMDMRLQLTDRMGNPCRMNNVYVAASLHFVGNAEAEPEEISYEISHQHDFYFVNDWETSNLANRAKLQLQYKMSDKAKALKDTRAKLHELHQERRKLEVHVEQRRRVVQNMLSGSMNDLLGDATVALGKRLDELDTKVDGGLWTETTYYLRNTQDCTHARQRIQQAAPATGIRVPHTHRRWADEIKRNYTGVLGLLIDLIYMENKNHAAAVSVQCREALLTLIVRKRDDARDIITSNQYRGLQVISLDNVTQPYTNVRWHEGRSTLILHGHDPWKSWATHKAVVNRVQFHDPKNEELRAGVVCNLLSGVCIVENSEEEDKLIDECWKKKARYPDLINVSTKRKTRSNGVMGGRGQHTEVTDTMVATQRDLRPQQDKALADVMHAMNEHESFVRQLEEFKTGNEKGDGIAHYENEIMRLENQMRELEEQRSQLLQNGHSSHSAGPDVVEDQTGTVPPELELSAGGSSAAGGGAVAGAEEVRNHVFDFNVRGQVQIQDVRIRPEYGNQQGLYKLLFTVYCKDGNNPPSLSDVKLQREFADKRDSGEVIVVADDDGDEMKE